MTKIKLEFGDTGEVRDPLRIVALETERSFPEAVAVVCDYDAVEAYDDLEFTHVLLNEDFEHPLVCSLVKNDLTDFLNTGNYHFNWLAMAVFRSPPSTTELNMLYAEGNDIFVTPSIEMKLNTSIVELYLNDDCELYVQTTDNAFGEFLLSSCQKFGIFSDLSPKES